MPSMRKVLQQVQQSKLTHVVALIIGAIAAAGLTVVIDNPSPGHHTVTVHVGQVKPVAVTTTLGGTPHTPLTLPPQAQAIVADQAAESKAPGADESKLKEPALPTQAQVQEATQAAPAGVPAVPASVTDAAPQISGCASTFVRNYSHRAPGAHVELGVLHWTGSVPTLGSPNGGKAIVRWFDTAASQVSSNELTDQDGRCWYLVPEALKAWTQVSANSWAVSVEITNIGTAHPLFQTARARAAVIRLMVGWHHRWHLPYQRASVNASCVPIRAGFLSHKDLGPCGGGHPDIGDYNINALIAAAKRADTRIVSAADRLRCWRLNHWRAAGRPVKGTALAVKRKRLLAKHHVVCLAGHPARR